MSWRDSGSTRLRYLRHQPDHYLLKIGYFAQSKTTINLEDAYFDPRFTNEINLKIGCRTKSVLCEPIFDTNTKVLIDK